MEIQTSGGKMHYAERGQGATVLFLHGVPTHSYLWRNVLNHMDGFRTITVDLIGYGASEKPQNADLSLAAQSEYINEFLDKMKVDNAHLVGHDIGGGIAQILSVKHGEKVRSLTLIDSVGLDYWPIPQFGRLKDRVWDSLIQRIDLAEGMKHSFIDGVVNKERVTDEVMKEYSKPFEGAEGKMAYLRVARALDFRDTMKIVDGLRTLENPILVIWGMEDKYLPPEWGRRLAKVMPNSKLLFLGDVGHFAPEDDPFLLGAVIRGFLQSTI